MPRSRVIELTLLLFILAVAAALRWYGLAWDQGYLFHPDERQIVMVASNLAWPQSLGEFFSPASPLNPRFFAYGSFPIYLLRALAPLTPPSNLTGPWANDFLAGWTIFARGISGLFDLGSIILIYLLGRKLYGAGAGLIAAACAAVAVLHIQLAHFYTVDSILTFFVLATLYSAWQMVAASDPRRARWLAVAGASLGLALATKASALPLVVPLAVACWLAQTRYQENGIRSWRQVTRFVMQGMRTIAVPMLQIAAVAIIVFIITQPYALIDGFNYASAVVRESLIARGVLDYPYTRQYTGTIPFIYPIWQSSVWGMGLPLGIFTWAGSALFIYQTARNRDRAGLFLLSWSTVYFLVIGGQFVKYPRYLLPILPILFLMAARAMLSVRLPARSKQATLALFLGSGLLYSLGFVGMYSREHPWLAVSRWIYENVKPGSTIAIEQWDDALPVQLKVEGVTRTGGEYTWLTLPIQNADDAEKLAQMSEMLSRADAIVVSSQRGYGSVGRLFDRYPLIARYYRLLFGCRLAFDMEQTRFNAPTLGPFEIDDDRWMGLPICGQTNAMRTGWNWGFEDESLTVYDHPMPIVFVRTRAMSADEIRSLLKIAN